MVCVALLLAATGAAGPSAFAQGGVELGVRAGGTVGHLRSTRGITGPLLGPAAGLYGRLPIARGVALRSGVFYTRKGGWGAREDIARSYSDVTVRGAGLGGVTVQLDIERVAFEGLDASARLALDYVEVPLLVEVALPVAADERVRLQAGLFAAYGWRRAAAVDLEGDPRVTALRGTAVVGGIPVDLSTLVGPGGVGGRTVLGAVIGTDAADEYLARTDFGLVLGGLWMTHVGGRDVGLELRYDLGLATITKADDTLARTVIDVGGLEGRTGALHVALVVPLY